MYLQRNRPGAIRGALGPKLDSTLLCGIRTLMPYPSDLLLAEKTGG
jgi:hypothetical protein